MTEDPLVLVYAAGILLGFLLGMPVMFTLCLAWWRSETKRLFEIKDTLFGYPIHWTEDLGAGEIVLADFRGYERVKVKMRIGGKDEAL